MGFPHTAVIFFALISGDVVLFLTTLPETNSSFAPENGWLECSFPFGSFRPIFRCQNMLQTMIIDHEHRELNLVEIEHRKNYDSLEISGPRSPHAMWEDTAFM